MFIIIVTIALGLLALALQQCFPSFLVCIPRSEYLHALVLSRVLRNIQAARRALELELVKAPLIVVIRGVCVWGGGVWRACACQARL